MSSPPPLFVPSQPNNHTIPLYHQTISLLVFNHPQQSVVIHSVDVAQEFEFPILLGTPPCRVFVLCRVCSCCWLCPSNKLSRLFCNIASHGFCTHCEVRSWVQCWLAMLWYHFFNSDTISIRYLPYKMSRYRY